jgi:ribonuclease HI
MKHKSLAIYIDGAARGNPGPAGAGIVIVDEKGNSISDISKFLGNATNNVAEYTALIFGMEEARNLEAESLTINTDSELLAKQLGGEYKVKNPALKELHSKVMRLLDSFSDVMVNNIPREENKGADKLANKAIDDAGKKRVGKSFVLKSKNNIKESLF